MYISYLMGAKTISNQSLIDLNITIVDTTESGSRKITIPTDKINLYKDLIRNKLQSGYWNEFLDEKEICFIFKFPNGEIKEYILSPENEKEVAFLCSQFNKEPLENMRNMYTYLSKNDFYHDFMLTHYKEIINK